MKTLLSIAASALAMSSTALAVGSAIINNKCNFPVYLWHVSSDKSQSTPTVLQAGSGTYSEQFITCSSGGVSLKLSKSDSLSDEITQYEYTLEPTMVFYDISNVNCNGTGCPFQADGMTLTPSSSSCTTVTCAGGDETCEQAYTLWDDNWASHGCDPSSDLTLTLCTNGDAAGSSSGGDSAGYIGSSSSSSSIKAPPPSSPAATSSSAAAQIEVAAVPSSSSSSSPTPSSPSTTPSSTTLATSTKKTEAPEPSTTAAPQYNEQPAISWVTEVAIETVHSTVVVTVRDMSHEEYHKNKARNAAPHPHARRHQHHH